jgi:two-component system response regulator PilR (NtrC family)
MNDTTLPIMIVESSDHLRKFLVDRLNGYFNMTVVGIANAEEATRLMDIHPFDLVITSIKLPNASGLDLCQMVNLTHPQVPVILLSNTGETSWMTEAARLNIYDFIAEPNDTLRLLLSIKGALEARSSRQMPHPQRSGILTPGQAAGSKTVGLTNTIT